MEMSDTMMLRIARERMRKAARRAKWNRLWNALLDILK